MSEEHVEFDQLDAYALGTLEAAQAEGVRAHVETCARCRAELGEIQSVVDVMPLSLEPQASESLLERILASLDVAPSAAVDEPSPAGGEATPARASRAPAARAPAPQRATEPARRRPSPLVAGLAAALALAVGLDVWLAALVRTSRPSSPTATPTPVALATPPLPVQPSARGGASATPRGSTSPEPTSSSGDARNGAPAARVARLESALAAARASEADAAVARRSSEAALARERSRVADLRAHLAEAEGRSLARIAPGTAAREPAAGASPAPETRATVAPPRFATPTATPPTVVTPTAAPPTVATPTGSPPTVAPPTGAPPTVAPPTAAPPPSERVLVDALSTGHVYAVDGAIGSQPWHLTIVQPLADKNALIYTQTPSAPAGSTYRAWVLRGGTTYDAGELPPDAETTLQMPMPLRAGDVVAFSREPVGGGAKPTSPFLMQVTIGT